MKAEDRAFVKENITEMMGAATCSDEAKKAGQAWLDAAGTNAEDDATRTLIAELMECVLPIDDVIAFTSSEKGKELFGAEKAAQMAAHGKEIKEQGILYCDCPACTPAKAILERRIELVP